MNAWLINCSSFLMYNIKCGCCWLFDAERDLCVDSKEKRVFSRLSLPNQHSAAVYIWEPVCFPGCEYYVCVVCAMKMKQNIIDSERCKNRIVAHANILQLWVLFIFQFSLQLWNHRVNWIWLMKPFQTSTGWTRKYKAINHKHYSVSSVSAYVHCCCVNPHVVLSSRGLQHSGEETVGKGEAGEPEQVGGLDHLCPVCKLIDSLAKIPGPRCQGLQWGVRLVDRESERERDMANLQSFHASSCWQPFILGTSSVQCSEHWGLISTRRGMQEWCGRIVWNFTSEVWT